MGRGAPGRALLQAHSGRGEPGHQRGPARRRTSTSRNTTSGCTTWWTRRASASFREGQRLLSHWNLRDEIKADYSDGEKGLAKQRMIAQVMDRIVTQTIPAAVVDNPYLDWNPFTNEVKATTARDSDRAAPVDVKVSNAPEPDTRYAVLLKTFQAVAQGRSLLPDRADADRAPLRREPPDPRGAREGDARGGALLSAGSQGRRADLEAARPPARALRRLVQRLPAARHVHRGAARRDRAQEIPDRRRPTRTTFPIFSSSSASPREKAKYLADHIEVDPARGSGHALGAAAARGQLAPAHARREGRHELQGLQHRRPRDGAQRRADVFLERRRLDAAAGRAQHGLHRGARVRLPGARPGAARPGQAGRDEPGARRR